MKMSRNLIEILIAQSIYGPYLIVLLAREQISLLSCPENVA